MAAGDAAFFVEVKKDMARGESYEQFLEKFKPKKTTDDCFTPNNIYGIVKDWAVKRYGITEKIVRPFWPDGDYEKGDYTGAVVIDNPPFSIFTKIIDFYLENGVKFFLFFQTQTLFSSFREGVCYLPCEASVTYENGARVNTSFVTNMSSHLIETAPDLCAAINKADRENNRKRQLPRMKYPDEVITATRMAAPCKHGQRITIDRDEAHFTRALDEQRERKKTIYGGGYILSSKATTRVRAARERAARGYAWSLSEREEEIRKGLK